MKLRSIEPTPSPNAMKLNLDEALKDGRQKTYTKENEQHAPQWARQLLQIEGVKSVFHTADFLSLERNPKGDWRSILAQARGVFGEQTKGSDMAQEGADSFGEVKVFIQQFRGIPMQIRIKTETEEVREALPQRFAAAAMEAGMASANLIKERKLVDGGVRYGDLNEIAQAVLEELDAAYPDSRLDELKKRALKMEPGEELETAKDLSLQQVEEALQSSEWKKRYAALEQMKPSPESMPILQKAIHDPQMSIRRLAVVYLGEIEHKEGVGLLIQALKDPSAAVRRTAGDTLSDLGDPRAIAPMCEALFDKNKLVRWRAARFLYEVGDDSALDALQQAKEDPEFEVSLQVNIALERIEKGEEAEGTIWQQMTRARNQSSP